MTTEQAHSSLTSHRVEAIRRYVIWGDSSVLDGSIESQSRLRTVLGHNGVANLQELHGVEVTDASGLVAETETFLVDSDLGIVAEAHWPEGGTTTHGSLGSVLDQSVDVLQLSVRPSNCLLHAGIATLRDLIECNQNDLLRIQNMGKKSLDEINRKLADLALEDRLPSPTEAPSPGFFPLALLLSFDEFSFPKDIARQLRDAGVSEVLDLVRMDIRSIRNRVDLKPTELRALQMRLLPHRLRFGSNPPKWFIDHLRECRFAFRHDINRITATNQMAAVSIVTEVEAPAPSCLQEELESMLQPKARKKWLPVIGRVLGLDGGDGLTLEAAGQEFGVTRERIRQIVSNALQDRSLPATSLLHQAIDVIGNHAPCLAEQAEARLVEMKIVRPAMRIEGVLATARVFDIEAPWCLEEHGSSRLILRPEDRARITDFIRESRRRVSHFGLTRKSYVLDELGWTPGDDGIEICCAALEGLVWLDESHDWFWVPTGRNAIASRLAKILRVTASVDITLARKGVLKDRRMEETELPLDVFRTFCNLMPWSRADEEAVHAMENVPQDDAADSNEVLICRILRENGSVMWTRDLWRLASEAGVEKVSFYRLLSDSNVLVRLAPEVYGLIGSSGMPTGSPDSAPRAQTASPEEVQPEEVTAANLQSDSFLAGCDPGELDFPLQLLSRVLSHSAGLRQRGVWSLVELKWTDLDLERIRAWSKIWAFDVRELRHRFVNYGPARFSGYEALALVFLACGSDTAMLCADESEMWPTIQSAFAAGLREQLFQGPGIPKARIREATERICNRLRLRHVFGREGEQSWRRTVFLQFGITRTGRKRLPWWLTGNSILPVAVEDLLSSPVLRSESFGEFWRTLQRYRAGQLTRMRSVDLLEHNPWVPNAEIDAVLSAAGERRDLQRSQDSITETTTEDTGGLFDAPLLSWQSDPPVFELQIKRNSRWLTEPRYALALSNGRRISVVLRDGQYHVDGRLTVDLSEAAVTVDLRRGQLSCLPEPISISFLPEGFEFLFYDLTSGQQLLPGNDRIPQNRPIALLAKASLDTSSNALETRRIFEGNWIIRAYRDGVPRGFEIRRDGRTLWAAEDIRTPNDGTEAPRVRVTCPGGRWGEAATFTVHPAHDATPTHLLTGGVRVELNKVVDGTYRAALPLAPSDNYEDARVRVECIWKDRIRWFRATLSIGPVEGIAIESEDGWKVLKETGDMDASFLATHRIFARLPAQFGGDRVLMGDWAWMEGSHFCGRPRTAPMILGTAVHAVGEPLRLGVGPYNQTREGNKIARSVIQSGVISWIEQKETYWHIQFRRSFELGPDHDVWIWPACEGRPHILKRSDWSQEEDTCVASVEAGRAPVAFAVSFQGIWLGARTCGQGWAGLVDLLRGCENWRDSAPWFKWWRVPLLHPILKPIASELARSQPVATLEAWMFDGGRQTEARPSDEHEDAWRALTRTLLWDWLPTPLEAATVLNHSGLLTGVFEDDLRCAWDSYDQLLALNPMLLAEVAVRGASKLYSNVPDASCQLLTKLRNMILELDAQSPKDAVSRALQDARRIASEAMAVDEAFVSKSLLPDALAYARGRLDRQNNLRVALANSYAVPQYLAAAMIDKAISGEAI